MSYRVKSYAAHSPIGRLGLFEFDRRSPRADDVVIEILYCGVCHSDVHNVRNDWGNAQYPMVPGHEIVGRVLEVGPEVTRVKPGDRVGVGCLVESCRHCRACSKGWEQYCENGATYTYNATDPADGTRTYGGYSEKVVVAEHFVLKVPDALELAGAAPLLCAGITTYSPLRHWNVEPGSQVAIVGLGGLGHMAVKLAASMGAEVTMLSTSRAKEADARRLGAHAFALTSDEATFERLDGHFDLIVDTISAPHDYDKYLGMLRPQSTMVVVGVPPEPTPVNAFSLIGGNKRLAGSLIGGIAETQEMLDYCGKHGIVSDIEVIPIQRINEAYERMMKADVRYRFVIDVASLNAS